MISKTLTLLLVFNLIALTTISGQTRTTEQIETSRRTAVKIASDSNNLAEVKMLTGEKPFRADNPMTVLYMHRNTPVPQLAARLAPLQPLLDRLLAKEADDRFATAAETAQALNAARTAWLELPAGT